MEKDLTIVDAWEFLSADDFKIYEPLPVPAAYAEPIERLINALTPEKTVLILRSKAADSAEWLTRERIETALRGAMTAPMTLQVSQLTADIWAVSLSLPGTTEDPFGAVQIHAMSRALSERLGSWWIADQPGELKSLPAPPIAANEETPSEDADAANETSVPLALAAPQPSPFFVTAVAPMVAAEEIEGHIAELNSLLDIIVNKQLSSQFQPIVDLRDGQVFGYEALIRGPKGKLLRRFGDMFEAADKASMVAWFDLACQEQCFARAAQVGLKKLLFVNMDAAGLAFLDMHERTLGSRAREYGLAPTSIVIEITERQAIEDFPRLVQYIGKLRDEGFRIAIDDAGAGYNSLYTIAEIRPDFVKIDRALTRNLDVRGERRALLAALVQYARSIGTAILAEGSETREELAALIDLGVPYGQGYLMGRPADDFRGVPKDIREFIQQRSAQHTHRTVGRHTLIGGIARAGLALNGDTPIAFAAQKFAKDPSLTSVVIIEDDYPCGLLMRQQVQHVLDIASAAHVADLLPSETVAQWMDTRFVCVQADMPISVVVRQATTRLEVSLEADIVLAGAGGKYAGVVPMRQLLEVVANRQESRQRYASSLTGMPGLVPCEQVLQERLAASEPVAVLRIDVCHLEPINRAYGVLQGDHVIQTLALHLHDTMEQHGAPGDETAHLGGDNFLILTRPENAGQIQRELHARFNKTLPQLYRDAHYRQGFLEIAESGGNSRRVPLCQLAVAIYDSRNQKNVSAVQVLKQLDAQVSRNERPAEFPAKNLPRAA